MPDSKEIMSLHPSRLPRASLSRSLCILIESGKGRQRVDTFTQPAPTPQEESAYARSLLGRIINDLPERRDWLDPDLEREARAFLEGKHHGA